VVCDVGFSEVPARRSPAQRDAGGTLTCAGMQAIKMNIPVLLPGTGVVAKYDVGYFNSIPANNAGFLLK